MSNGAAGGESVSRRAVLARATLAFGAATCGAAATRAFAQQKVGQPEAKYQGGPKGRQSCSICASFQPPNACKLVQGTISPLGWCLLFAPKT